MSWKYHDLKIWPEYYRAVVYGDKTFEIRKNDRDFRVGDTIRLREYDPRDCKYTGEDIEITITFVTDFEQKDGNVVLGFKKKQSNS